MVDGIQPLEMSGGTGNSSRKALKSECTLHGQVLETVTSAKYLGVDIPVTNREIPTLTGS